MAVLKSMRSLLESLSLLLEQHLKLLHKELSEELRTLLGSFLALVLCLLPLLFSCVFVNISLVFLFEKLMPIWAALLLVGLLNFMLGGFGIWWAARRLNALKFVPETMKELFMTRQVILQSPRHPEEGEFVGEDAASRRDDAGT